MNSNLYPTVSLSSGDPWNLSLIVSSVGPDYLCRIHGGDRHIGAVALGQWDSGRVVLESLVVDGHKETSIARHAAHQLCRAVERNVMCMAGIHFDDITAEQIDEVVQAVYAMTRKAVVEIEHERVVRELQEPGGLHSRIMMRSRALRHEIETFFSTPMEELLSRMEPQLGRDFARHFQNRILVFAPLYLSNACSNDCAYCGFRKSARFSRTQLPIDRLVEEARHLAGQGHRTIDLVTGEVPTDPFVDYVCGAVVRILAESDIGRINLNLGTLSIDQFKRLREAGATGYHLYQETYDPQTYFAVHRTGPKRDMARRLEGPTRAIEAGFEVIGLGILLGLRPPAEELAHVIRHALVLTEEHPGIRLGFSLPRFQTVDDACDYVPPVAVTDEQFIKAMLFLRLAFPDSHLTVTTRETPAVRNTLLSLGASKISAGVSTAPGGYACAAETDAGQFSISDQRSLGEMAEAVRVAGFELVYE